MPLEMRQFLRRPVSALESNGWTSGEKSYVRMTWKIHETDFFRHVASGAELVRSCEQAAASI